MLPGTIRGLISWRSERAPRIPYEIAGIDNHVTIELHGVSRKIDVVAVDSTPFDTTGTNTVTVLR